MKAISLLAAILALSLVLPVKAEGFEGVTDGSHIVHYAGGDEYLFVVVTWERDQKDLRLTVTDPNGQVFVSDNHSGTSYEWLARPAPLTVGDWSIEVTNNGGGSVAYHATVQFD